MFDLEKIGNLKNLAGCDEVGRGPLAGPVVGSCVLVSKDFLCAENLLYLESLGVTDSKKLSTKKRKKILQELGIGDYKVNELVSHTIHNSFKISFSVRELSSLVIDEINILQASLKAMGDAFSDCYSSGSCKLLVDGNKTIGITTEGVSEECVVKGDAKSAVIGLASIIAKEYRDDLMKDLSVSYPHYGLDKHAGYPTKEHREAIMKLGVTPIHRKSFKGVREYCL